MALPGTTLSVDIGGSGIKTLLLDQRGSPISERRREPTPRPARPKPVLELISKLAGEVDYFDRIAVGFPGVVIDNVVKTAVNLHPEWIDFPLGRELEVRLERMVKVANDADLQGLAAVEGKGVEVVLTLGTGMGSALFHEGVLVPNLELAHHPFRKKLTYEEYVGRAALDAIGVKRWSKRVVRVVETIQPIWNPRRIYLGGGNAKKLKPNQLPRYVEVVPNLAGLLGGFKLWDID